MEDSSRTIRLTALWDKSAGVWSASSDNMPGLITEADTLDELAENIVSVYQVLIEVCKKNHPQGVVFEIECFREGVRTTPIYDLSMRHTPQQFQATVE